MSILLFIHVFFFITIILSIRLITLLERKSLASIQSRLGPNKNRVTSIFQPLADGIKLLIKFHSISYSLSISLLLISAISILLITVRFIVVSVDISFSVVLPLRIMLVIILVGCSIYRMLVISYSSNSKYTRLSIVRSLVLTISYEVVLSFRLLILSIVQCSLSVSQLSYCIVVIILPVTIILILTIVIEVNRAPFDIREGESELVSGFNIETSSVTFTLIFLSEYGLSLLLLLLLINVVFEGIILVLILTCALLLLLLLRTLYPRVRYDSMISMMWTYILLVTVIMLLLIITYLVGVVTLYWV